MARATDLILKARGLRRVGQDDRAIAAIDSAIVLAPWWPFGYVRRAEIHFTNRRFEDCVLDFDRAIAIEPRWAQAHGYRAMALAHLGQLDSAEEATRRAFALDPRTPAAYYARAVIRMTRKEPGAVEDLEAVIRLAPDDSIADNAQEILDILRK